MMVYKLFYSPTQIHIHQIRIMWWAKKCFCSCNVISRSFHDLIFRRGFGIGKYCSETWVQLFWIQNLKMPMFFCLNMLEIWIQIIFEAKWPWRDPAVFPSPAILYVALSRRVNTAAAVIVHIQIQFSNVIFQTWSSPLFQNISDFKLEIGQSHSVW